MNGEYLRVTPQELQRAIEDPEWAYEYAERLKDALSDPEAAAADRLLAQQRLLTTHKAWHAISFLLGQASFPVDAVFGEDTFTTEDDDWGYGPPRFLSPERVAEAAKAFAATTFAQLVSDVDPAELNAAEVYPLSWTRADVVEWVGQWYEPLPGYFAAAAHDGHAMLIWIS